jgi:hypothetical protein
VFIVLEASSLASTGMILFLAHRYRGLACDAHAHGAPTQRPARAAPTQENAADLCDARAPVARSMEA